MQGYLVIYYYTHEAGAESISLFFIAKRIRALARLASRRSLAYTAPMSRYGVVFFILCCSVPLAGCGTVYSDGRLYSHAYQQEAASRLPGHNLYSADSLDNSISQRVNQFSRCEISHVRQQNFVQRLTEAQALDKAAQKLGREPGSLFRR